MLIDNLHRINNPSDLFKYICELEESIEKDNEARDHMRKRLHETQEILRLFMCHDGWSPADKKTPVQSRCLEVYITAPGAEDSADGMFEMAHYYNDEGYRLCEACKDWTVRFWRYLGEPDSDG
jgi:hypothetical protein